MSSSPPMCQRCRARPATGNWLSVLGPLDTREAWYCRRCTETLLSDGNGEAPQKEGDLSGLGPIDFDVLRASIQRTEADPKIPREQFAAVAPELLHIAAAHGQTLPDDILAFVARHSGGRAGT